jgi:two-component system NtrC family sensor kinase
MNRNLIIILFLFSGLSLCAQLSVEETIRFQIDSILRNIELENDEAERFNLLISIHRRRIQGFPTLYLETANKANKLAQKFKDPVMEAHSWSLYGQGYRLMGNYIKGLECHHHAIALAEETGNKLVLAIAQNELAHIYKDREENEKALRLYLTALGNAMHYQTSQVKAWPMMNLGAIYLAMNKPDSSLYYSQLALETFHTYGSVSNDPYIEMNIAGAYSLKGDISNASDQYYQALGHAYNLKSNRYINMVCVSLAEHYLRNKQPDSSAYYAKKAIASVEHTEFTFLSIKPAKLLTEIYETTNADSTLKYLRIFRTANDSLFNTRANQQVQVMTFEEEQRQHDLAAQKANYQYKIKLNFLLGGLCTILLIAVILFRNNKQKQKANALLHRQKKEIENTLSQLNTTQAQLVQSEKMASLGELTAGIAHEIQNPLNFVNNFSEVNTELIDEMKAELAIGNTQSAIHLADDIKENQIKITDHGKRADAIVKGMLQHSRSSSGVKEPTDINILADEYLRLAYHGLRAKDKSFNATLKTDFDESIGMINIVPQDIGRVILNLITNAFYAVSAPKSPEKDLPFIPTVSLSTKLLKSPSGDLGEKRVQISVRDNGPGIPASVLDKIFQPFFTTKPTGQGTGLGLSLSYDIVKAHGGELSVETKEGEGTVFTIQLPAN